MQQAKYLNDLVCECAPTNGFAQDAIEWGVLSGHILLSFNMETDTHQVMRLYDELIVKYRETRERNYQALLNQYKGTQSAEEIQQPE